MAGHVQTHDSEIDLARWEDWRALESPGHDPLTHCLSFAIGPAECLELQKMPSGWDRARFDDSGWSAVVGRESPPWGELQPRAIPMLDESRVVPSGEKGVWSSEPICEETLHSVAVIAKGGLGVATDAFVAVQRYLHSREPRTVTLATWWGKHFLNGVEIKPVDAPKGQMRREVTVPLKAGWNRLLVAEKTTWDYFDFTLGVPDGIAISAEPEADSPNAFLIGGPWEGQQAQDARKLDWSQIDLAQLPAPYAPAVGWPKGKSSQFPMKRHGWRAFSPVTDHRSLSGHSAASFLFEFPGEVLGRPLVKYHAKPGTTIDLFYAERLRPDGSADVHHFPWGLFTADRFVTDERQTPLHTFHPRGFKYLEVFVTGDLHGFELREVSATRANYPVGEVGKFKCSDPMLEQIWEIGRAAQHACMEDAYLDCPWRERGLYAGDTLVQFHVDLAAFGDTRLAARCIDLFLQRQTPGHGLGDYSAITLLALHDYWSVTGDVATVRRLLPHWSELAEGLASQKMAQPPLLGPIDAEPYIDLCHLDREGINCSLNCFYYGAFRAAADLFELCAQVADGHVYRARADALAEAIRLHFWSEEYGYFFDRADKVSEPSVPANTLPLFFGLASPEQTVRSLAWLETTLQNNHRVPNPQRFEDLNVNAYFSFYVLAVFYSHGKVSAAEEFIRRNWGPMVDAGAWATTEYFIDDASRCHAWAASPTHYLSTEVLGVRRAEPGNPNKFVIHPNPGTLTWASGDYPHPLGPIHVEWRLVDGKPHVQYLAPEGVEISAIGDRF